MLANKHTKFVMYVQISSIFAPWSLYANNPPPPILKQIDAAVYDTQKFSSVNLTVIVLVVF